MAIENGSTQICEILHQQTFKSVVSRSFVFWCVGPCKSGNSGISEKGGILKKRVATSLLEIAATQAVIDEDVISFVEQVLKRVGIHSSSKFRVLDEDLGL